MPLNVNHVSISHREDLEGCLLDLGGAPLASAAFVDDCERAIPGVDYVVYLERPVGESSGPHAHRLSDAFWSLIDLPLGPNCHVELHLRVEAPQSGFGIPAE